MYCFMCFSVVGKLQMIKIDMDNEIVERITCVLPDLLIPESLDPVFICSTCLEQVSFFYTIKKTSLQNCSRLKYCNAMLKGTNNLKCNEIRVVINCDQVSAQCKHHIEFKVNPKSKYLLSSNKQEATRIKEEDEEYDDCSQQSENYEVNLNHLQDDESSSSSTTDSSQYHENSHVNKFTKTDSNLTSSDSCHQGQPKTQLGNQKKRFKCTECYKTFTHRSHLKRHSHVHTEEKPFKCEVCQKTFTLRSNLKVHKFTHTGEKPYKCTTCQKTFTTFANLNSHKLTHTGEKPHECDVCHKTFNHKSNLIDHKRIHNNVRPFKCAVCSKGFTQSGALNRHMLTHTGEKLHQCHLCEYKCTRADHLKIHIRCHTGEKPYSCKHCEKSFRTTSDLKVHERRIHSNEDSV